MAKRRFLLTFPVLFLGLLLLAGALVWKLSQTALKLPGDLNFPRECHTATLLSNGNVLVVGGTYNEGITIKGLLNHYFKTGQRGLDRLPVTNYRSCEMYNPSTHTWTMVESLPSPRVYSTATCLTNGQVLVAGGLLDSSRSFINSELFDPLTLRWHATGALVMPQAYGEAVLMANEEVLIAGGAEDSLETFTDLMLHLRTIHNTPLAECYNPSTKTWKAIPHFTFPYGGACIVLSNGKVLIAGGYDLTKQKSLIGCFLYDPIKGTFATTGPLVDYSQSKFIKLDDGRVLSVGDKDCALYDPTTETWTKTGSMISPIGYCSSTTLLQSGKVLLIQSPPFGTSLTGECDLYDPKSGTWSRTGNLKKPRTENTTTCLKDGRVLVTGGEGQGEIGQEILSSCELYNPATGTWGDP